MPPSSALQHTLPRGRAKAIAMFKHSPPRTSLKAG